MVLTEPLKSIVPLLRISPLVTFAFENNVPACATYTVVSRSSWYSASIAWPVMLT